MSSISAQNYLRGNIANVSKNTICTLLKKDTLMKINKNNIKKVCMDNFYIRKRKTYGTVLINIENNTIIDMIDSREYNDIVFWLNTYPNIEVFSRDGSITYSSTIATLHPKAIQVSDRFHILKNLISYCTNYLSKYLIIT